MKAQGFVNAFKMICKAYVCVDLYYAVLHLKDYFTNFEVK